MINIRCDACGRQYQIDENKVKSLRVKVRCQTCGNFIYVTKPDKKTFQTPGVIDPEENDPSVQNGRSFPQISSATDAIDLEYPGTTQGKKVRFMDRIQVRVSLILIVLTTFILCGYVVFNYYTSKKRMTNELNEAAGNSTTRLAKNLVEPLWTLDEKQINEIMISEMKEKQMAGIIVRDSYNHAIIGGKSRDQNWNAMDTVREISGHNLLHSKKIMKDDEDIGVVEVYFTTRFMKEEFKQGVVNIAVTAFILDFSILIVTFLILRKMILLPIMKLKDVAERMSMGALDVEINIYSQNEIGLLSEAIDRMQASLRLAIERLSKRIE